jgi:hypothetical protein
MNRSKVVVLAVSLALGAGLLPPAAASAWAPTETATVHPGVQVFTEGGQCTANFVFQGGGDVYLGQAAHCAGTGGQTETDGCTSEMGQAAHCAGTGGQTETDGCTSGSLPLGTPVEVTGANQPGRLAYSSWLTMQAGGETDPDACAFNDFALIEIDPADVDKVNPSVPGFGGPTGVGAAGGFGSTVYSYGNSSLRGGVTLLSPKQGIVVQNQGNGWSHDVVTLTPGIPGDSGSGFMNKSGGAIGVLSTLQLAPLVGSNGVGDLARELAYMHANSPLAGVQLVPGTEPFKPNLAGAILGF